MNNQQLTEEELRWLSENFYIHPKKIDGVIFSVHRFIFTTAIIGGIDHIGYSHRWCFNTFVEAVGALKDMTESKGHPPGNWHRYMGPGGDFRRYEDGTVINKADDDAIISKDLEIFGSARICKTRR